MTRPIDEMQIDGWIAFAGQRGSALGGAVLAAVDEAHRRLHLIEALPQRLRILLLLAAPGGAPREERLEVLAPAHPVPQRHELRGDFRCLICGREQLFFYLL